MAYFIQFSDNVNRDPIIVEDRDVNDEVTSLSFPGKGVTEYGKIIAENMLHLLENFAFSQPPENPNEGQTWYDTTTNVDQLKIYDGTRWVPASGIFKATSSPEVSDALAGDLWADTDNEQLYLATGSGWVLIGPEFSAGSSTGPRAGLLTGTDNQDYAVLIIDVDQAPAVIISTNQFIPKTTIEGFPEIFPGINLSTVGALKYYGVAESAAALRIQNKNVPANRFLRSDIDTTANGIFSVRNNQGIQVGDNSQFSLLTDGTRSLIRNNFGGGGIDLQVKQGAEFRRVMRLNSNPGETPTVGINNLKPQETLDITGTLRVSDIVTLTSTETSDSPNDGALQVAGGAWIAKNLRVGTDATVKGNIDVKGNIVANGPTNQSIDGFESISASTFIGNFQGNLTGSFTGVAGSAIRLESSSTFSIAGDVVAPGISFNGAGNLTKEFNTTISNGFIINKTPSSFAEADDEVLVNRGSSLFKIKQSDFVASVPTTPPGAMMPYGGATAPPGWLLCDGSTVERSTYPELFDIIGHQFLDTVTLQDDLGLSPSLWFGLPDFRGRFPLGNDAMGGNNANRVSSLSAEIVGNVGGSETTDVTKSNLPAHEHDLVSSGTNAKQYYAIRDAALDSLSDSPEAESLNIEAVGASSATVSGIPSSGSIQGGGTDGLGNYRDVAGEDLGAALNTMNPYTTVNYIICTGNV
jgi:microcystin-dependent protein